VPRFSSIDEYLVDATLGLPPSVAMAMEEALAGGQYLIRAGSYARGEAMCPLGAADANQRNSGVASKAGSSEGLGGQLIRFAVSFDLYAAEFGDEAAVRVVAGALERFRPSNQGREL
jgi:hypothetical protein